MSVFCIWSNCRYVEPHLELSLAILSSFPSWAGSMQRYGEKPPSAWSPHDSSSGCSAPPLLPPSSLLLPWAGHTHTHTNTARINKHVCIHTHAQHGDTNANNEHRCFRRRRGLTPAMSEMVTVGNMPCPWGSLFIFSTNSSIFYQGSLKPLPAQHVCWL